MSRISCSLVSVVLVLSLASTSFGTVIGDFEDGVGSWKLTWEAATKPELAIAVSEIGATSGKQSLAVSTPTGWAWAVMYEGLVDTTQYTAISADITWVASEWTAGDGPWVNFKDLAINSNGPSGWKQFVPSDPCNPNSPGSWDPVNWGNHTRTLTWDISGYDATGATWMQLVFSTNMGGITKPGKFYIDNVQLIPPTPPAKKKIVFVSFHGADDAPSAGAVGVGFTAAPDKMYTDLLKIKDYDVVRYVQTGTPDVNMLNAADLVIISRSVASGSFQNAAATTWNTKVTAPMMMLNGYILRKSRLGFSTGTNLPDATGDIRLAVSDVNNPIFKGVALTSGTMDNPFAGLVVYPTDGTTKARGISINTDAADPNGVVLATVAASADPNVPANGPVGGIVIAEWPAGVTVTHDGGAGKDVLAGRRLVFLTGSREADGKSSETAGMYDLSPEGMTMFLSAVDYMLNPPPAPAVSMLTNGGFEDGVLAPWNVYGPATVTSEVVTELKDANVPEGVIEGTYCLYVNVATATANFWDAGLQPKPVVFEKGKKYTLSAFMKAKKGTVQINMKPELAADPWSGYGEKMMTVTEEWKEYSVTTPVFPADTAPAGITFHIGAAVGGFWIDGVRFYEGDYVKP